MNNKKKMKHINNLQKSNAEMDSIDRFWVEVKTFEEIISEGRQAGENIGFNKGRQEGEQQGQQKGQIITFIKTNFKNKF